MAGARTSGKKMRRRVRGAGRRMQQNIRTQRNVQRRRAKFEAWCRAKVAELRAAGKEGQAGKVLAHLHRHQNKTTRWT